MSNFIFFPEYLPLVLVGSCSGSNESMVVGFSASVKVDFAATSLSCATTSDLLDSMLVGSDLMLVGRDLLYRLCTV